MLELRALRGPTGRLLREMLNEKGLLRGRVRGVVNYGYGGGGDGLPVLNVKAGCCNKYEELVALDEAGVQTVPFMAQAKAHPQFPVLGRKFHHTRGRDIVVYSKGVLPRLGDYYTLLIPKQKEFRVWVFRDKHLATYEKKLEYPERYGRRGRSKEIWNWGNGFAYEFVRNASQALKTLAINAVDALDLDFGGVDIILGVDRRYYVLEVNTAPGTQGEPRQGLTSLVEKIQWWAENGFPER